MNLVLLAVFGVALAACSSTEGGGSGGETPGGSTSTSSDAGASTSSDAGAGGTGGGVDATGCPGHLPDDPTAPRFACGDDLCWRGQACVRSSEPAGGHCPEPAGCPLPPSGSCWVYACWNMPPDCATCECMEPYLADDTAPPETCSDEDGHVWIKDAATSGRPTWSVPCNDACRGDGTCWLCGPIGGCNPDGNECQPRESCSVGNPTNFPHPMCDPAE